MSENLPANPKQGSTPSCQERGKHREWITGRVLTLLSHYWRDDDPLELTAALGRDWADVLEGLPQDFIQLACIQYQREEPRRRPTPGAVYQIASQLMKRDICVPVPFTEIYRTATPEENAAYLESVRRDRINPERAAQAQAILRQFGGKS